MSTHPHHVSSVSLTSAGSVQQDTTVLHSRRQQEYGQTHVRQWSLSITSREEGTSGELRYHHARIDDVGRRLYQVEALTPTSQRVHTRPEHHVKRLPWLSSWQGLRRVEGVGTLSRLSNASIGPTGKVTGGTIVGSLRAGNSFGGCLRWRSKCHSGH